MLRIVASDLDNVEQRVRNNWETGSISLARILRETPGATDRRADRL